MQKNFKELNRRAAGKIRGAIKKLSGQDVKVDIVAMKKGDIREVESLVRSEEKVAVIYLPITGALEGSAVFVFNRESALAMADYLQKRKPGTTSALTQLDISALKEFGNITVSSYLSVIANETNIVVKSHGGRFSFDVFSAIAEEVIADLMKDQKEVYVVEILFSFEVHTHKGEILFLFKDSKLSEFFAGGGGV